MLGNIPLHGIQHHKGEFIFLFTCLVNVLHINILCTIDKMTWTPP